MVSPAATGMAIWKRFCEVRRCINRPPSGPLAATTGCRKPTRKNVAPAQKTPDKI